MKKFLLIGGAILVTAAVTISIFLKFPKTEPLPKDDRQMIETSNSYFVDIKGICQYPTLPTGCEATAAVTVLQFLGADTSLSDFANRYLERDASFYYSGGRLHGPDPHKTFVGDPFSSTGYGCFSEVIVKAVRKMTKFDAEVIRNKNVAELCEEYIRVGKPILLWVTMSMREPYDGTVWITPDGKEFIWPAGEHCMVLSGYDEEYYHLLDPQSGSRVLYEKNLVEKRFSELGSQAVYIYRKQ